MVVKGTNNGNKRKIEEVSTPSSSPKNLCSPSAGSPPISTKSIAPRPRAQRKFAQGAYIPSPPVTPQKDKPLTPAKRVPLPQYSPPIKRPKTEDFLTFLCYRGTPALPKNLNFFNYPSVYDRVEYVKVKPRREIKKWKESATTSQLSQSTHQRSQSEHGEGPNKDKNNTAKKRNSESTKTAKSLKDKKATTSSTSTSISITHPKPTHINEKEAKFAISALKLKYQEKRIASSNPTLSVATKIANKVKGRRVILTRSKSKDDSNTTTEYSKRPKKYIDTVQELNRRNAPSPDIIDGVQLNRASKNQSSSSESESSSSDENDSSSTTSKSTNTANKKNNDTRSLRSGRRPIVTAKPNKSKITAKIAELHRISTRASRRNSTSPLRELPMYGVFKKRKKKLKEKLSRKKKAEKKDKEKEKSPDRSQGSRRPSRKTKESAAFFLNLITNSFSSDENENGDKSDDKDDSEGDTSSSETKSLETRYKAIMKRGEQKIKNRSKPQPKQNSAASSKSTSSKAVKSEPEKRILRSQSTKEDRDRRQKNEAARVTRRRVTIPVSPADKPVHAGAARKSASVYPRRNKRSSSSSSSSSSDDSDSSSSETSDSNSKSEDSSPVKEVKPGKRKSFPKKRAGSKESNKNSSSSDENNETETDPEIENEKKPISKCKRKSSGNTVKSPQSSNSEKTESTSSDSGSVETESDSSSSEEEKVVEKVEIAIQVDMDLEESEQEAALHSSESPIPPVLTPHVNYTSQGCQSEIPPCSSSIRIHNSSLGQPDPPPPPPITLSLPIQHQTHISMSHSHTPLHMPFPGQSFYPALGNIEFISQQRTQQDFSVMLPTLSLPTVSGVPTYSFGPSTVLTHPNIPIGYTSASISAATTLQTSIRSVASNLDIPLVRPVVTPNNMLSIRLTRPHAMDPHRPLTRPIVNIWQDTSQPQQPIPHFSAFRVPISTSVSTGPGPPQRHIMNTSNFNSQYTQNRFQITQSIPASHGTTVIPQRPSTSTSSFPSIPGMSAHGLSLIKSLPNVSIVPKFDRTTKTVIIPPDQQVASTVVSTAPKPEKHSSKKIKICPPKEKGRKRKELPFTKASSPLTVRKDSSNPVTYVGVASKKYGKDRQDSKVETSSQSQIPSDQFNQLLEKSTKSSSTSHPPSLEIHCIETSTMKSVDTEMRNDDSKSDKSELKTYKAKKQKKLGTSKGSDSKRESNKILENSDEPTKHNSDKKHKLKKLAKQEKELMKTKKSKDEKPEKISKSKKSEESLPKAKSNTNLEYKPKKSKSRVDSPRPESVSSERSKAESTDDREVKLEEAPAFYPTDEEFKDPLAYISSIQKQAERYGIARIVPPKSFRPECNVEDDMRFTAYNHYIHRMYKRWGPNVHVRVGILENLRKPNVGISTGNPPVVGGMEVDLTTLYQTVQSLGGLAEVINEVNGNKWNQVSDEMHIPKSANDRASKLRAIYLKYVLPYETLSDDERKKLLDQVEKKWKIRENRNPESSEDDSEEDDPFLEAEDCITKGKNTPLSSYYRVARNTINMLFPNHEPSCNEVESDYWELVRNRDKHICVYSGSIDCAGLGWGFPLPKEKAGAKHPWNLKVLAKNPASILSSMGSVMGATVPTLHVGMVFTTYCWYKDPHNLPWIEYLHSGGNKIWYVIPASHEESFRNVMKKLMPHQCKDKKIWLTSDSAMVPPELLLSHGIPLYRAVQNPGEFLVVFPKVFTSSICTGYVISESVCYAMPDWLLTAYETFQDIKDSKEPPVFPLEKLLLNILSDPKVSIEILKLALPLAERILNEEYALRKKLLDIGVKTGKMSISNVDEKKSRKKEEIEVTECDTCNYVLYLSQLNHKNKKLYFCLPHGIQFLAKTKTRIKFSSLLYDHTDDQLRSILRTAQSRLK